MSLRLDPTAFELLRRQWTTTFPPVSPKDLEAWKTDWREGLAVLHYLSNLRIASTDHPDALITVRCTLHNQSLPFEGVAADLERVWANNLAEGLDPRHAFSSTTTLVMTFSGLTAQKCYVTGRLTVERE